MYLGIYLLLNFVAIYRGISWVLKLRVKQKKVGMKGFETQEEELY